MNLTGFDPDIVNTSINNVKQAYENLIRVIGDDMQTQFIGGMSDKWACPQARDFFCQAFEPAVNGLIESVNGTFESVIETMGLAAEGWAAQTGYSYKAQGFSRIVKKMDTSIILENINGVRGIDLASTESVVAKLQTILNSAQSALTSAQQAVQNCGFVGGAQAPNLLSSLGVIKNKIDNAITEITNSTREAINKTLESYTNTEGKISEAFTAQG